MIVIDTHVLIWVVNGDKRIPVPARNSIEEAADSGGVLVSAITPWEIAVLARKKRLDLGQEIGRWIEAALALAGIQLAPLSPAIAVDSNALPGAFHDDPADRIIVATARFHGVPLLTADRAILRYGEAGHVRTIAVKG